MEEVSEREQRVNVGGRLGLLGVVLIVACLLVAACSGGSDGESTGTSLPGSDGSSEEAEEDVPQPDPVDITLTATLSGTQVSLEGTATVPDGARLLYDMRHPSLTDPTVCQTAGRSCYAVGTALVEEGRWSASVDVAAWPPGEVNVSASFQMVLRVEGEEQSSEIVDLYGEKGERIIGEMVVEGVEETFAIARTTIVIPG